MRLRPELNWPYVTFVVVVLSLMCGVVAYFATSGPLAGGDTTANLLARIGVDALCLVTILVILIQLRNDAQLEIDDDGISKPTLIGSRTLRWTEIREIRSVGPGVRLVSADSSIVIHPYVYADPYGSMSEIVGRLRHLLPEPAGIAEAQPPSPAQEMSRGRLPRLLSTVTQPRYLASYGHIAAIPFYTFVLRDDLHGLGGRWLAVGVTLGLAANYLSQQLWKRASARTAGVIEVTWAVVVATIVWASSMSSNAFQRGANAFCVVFVTLLLLHLLIAWLQMIAAAAVKARREAAAAVRPARR